MNDDVTNYLSSLYGTEVQEDGEDLEKLAALEVLGQYADHLSIDLSDVDFSGHTVDDVKNAIGELEKIASGGDAGEGGLPEEMEQFDLAGRVMAHAFWQEREKIAANYQGKSGRIHDFLEADEAEDPKNRVTREKAMGRLTPAQAKALADKRGNAPKSADFGPSSPSFGQRMSRFGKSVRGAAGKVGAHLSANKKLYGVGAGAAALGGLAAYGASRSKKSSMIDEIAAQRLNELLEANGYEKVAGLDPVEAAIQARMAEMAEELGLELN